MEQQRSGTDRRHGIDVKAAMTILVFLFGLAVSAFVGYSASDKTMSNRIAVLETQQTETQKREQFFHEATDRRFIELREELKQVNDQLRKLIDLEIDRARDTR